MDMDTFYRGWRRPGPLPPGGIEPGEGETLDYLCGHYRIFQYAKGHRYSTDDVLTAWYGTLSAPRVERAADLGSGIGSVAIMAAWRLPSARFFTVEAQEISVRLAQKSILYNGLGSRISIRQGDLRDPAVLAGDGPFDLVLGSPPYWPEQNATAAEHPQAVPARLEVRGDLGDYARAASRMLAPGGFFAFVFPTLQLPRALEALRSADLALVRRRGVLFKEGEPSVVTLFAAARRQDLPPTYEAAVESPLVIRSRSGATPPEYAAVRLSMGFPPGNVPA